MTSLKTSIKTITYLSDTGCLEIQGASLRTLLNSVSKENGQSHKRQIENNDVIFFASLFMVRMSCF
ncbi:hypothetical protein CP957_02820 [Escherichia coli]|nr:hypothetical protein CRT55_03685 [Escherichia coli]AUL92080.1 hypothetical protein CR916_25065 [Escherichia coli]AUM20815.1 hypothetical protein CP957_02820 [Escherichia coli]